MNSNSNKLYIVEGNQMKFLSVILRLKIFNGKINGDHLEGKTLMVFKTHYNADLK